VKRLFTIAISSFALLIGAGGVAQANEAPSSLSYEYRYQIQGLDGLITSPTVFTVEQAPYTENLPPVCSMTFGGTTLAAAPWTFTYDPINAWSDPYNMQGNTRVYLDYCNGNKSTIYVEPNSPFQFRNRYVSDGTGAYSDPKESIPTVHNSTDETANVSVTNKKGSIVSSFTVQPQQTASLAFPKEKRTEKYLVTATTSSGTSMAVSFTKAKGWGLLLGGATVPPCSVVTWAYDNSRAPNKTLTFEKDLRESLNILSTETGLTFVEINDYKKAQLRYRWAPLSVAGTGSTDGTVTFSTKSFWVKDGYAGFKPFKANKNYTSGPSGRGWLIIHETMHSLGYDHVKDSKSIMAPINTGQGKFTKADLDGLHSVYRSHCGV